MSYQVEDTIAAIASPPGGAARGIVRMSGAGVAHCLAGCMVQHGVAFNPAAYPQHTSQVLQADIATDDVGKVPVELLYWPSDRSYTRQPSAELHTIGSPPVLQAVLTTVCSHGARLAEPGEFTMRSFLAGRLDLTQAEAVLGVIDATDRTQLNSALSQLAGGIGAPLNRLRAELLTLLAHLEAGLDFVEDDIEFITAEELDSQLGGIATQVASIASQMHSREDVAAAPRVILSGAPNAGKSSLMNALAAENAAIVSPIAGATRDYIEQQIQLGALSVTLVDTAGIETHSSPQNATGTDIAADAQQATFQQQKTADLELFCVDGSCSLTSWQQQQRQLLLKRENGMCVFTKSDLPSAVTAAAGELAVSSVTGAGMEQLRTTLEARLRTLAEPVTGVAATAARCRESLREAAAHLTAARDAAIAELGEELVAADVRSALQCIGQVTGAIYTDDILDKIFSTFCIGK